MISAIAVFSRKKGKMEAYAMKCVAAGAHLPTPWLFEPAKRPDDRTDYCLRYSSRTTRQFNGCFDIISMIFIIGILSCMFTHLSTNI